MSSYIDLVDLIKPGVGARFDSCLRMLWDENPAVYKLLRESETLEEARERMFDFLDARERDIYRDEQDLYALIRAMALESVHVLKSVFAPINEKRSRFSSLSLLWESARSPDRMNREQVSVGFVMEFIGFFRGIEAETGIYAESGRKGLPRFLELQGREAAVARTGALDEIGADLQAYLLRYPSGLEREIVEKRVENRQRILAYFEGRERDWNDPAWQIRHVIKDTAPLRELIELSPEQIAAIDKAKAHRIPFGITPYYLSLMDKEASSGLDHAVRAQVLPPPDYVDMMVEHKTNRNCYFDFMGEQDTSPIDLVTRRYPGVAILKPFNTCAQICVYCQRNWEIDQVLDPNAMSAWERIDEAVAWFDRHKAIGDVLITGGDPCIMPDKTMARLLEKIAAMDHVYRIRIGTRTPVVLPMRWTDDYTDTIARFNNPGHREICIVTHFMHPYEVTPEALQAVKRIRRAGISVYNQQVFTRENSRRFESSRLRIELRKIGVDPYYVFNMKGKEETGQYMVPIARILQERKEEARLLPGIDRTGEPVFNVPKLGKNHLRAGQDHWLVMIRADGSRVYEFHPWEKNIQLLPPYNYRDIPIYDYLLDLADRGEDLQDYRTIWYYF